MKKLSTEKEKLSKLIQSFDQKIEPLVLIFSKLRTKEKYKNYQVCFEDNIVANAYLKSIEDTLSSKELHDYDFEINKKDSIFRLDEKLVTESNLIHTKIVVDKDSIILNKEVNFKDFDFIIIQFYVNIGKSAKKLTLFSKYNQPASKFKKSFKYNFVNNTIKKLDSDVLYFDGLVDAFHIDGYYYIINESAFNNIFSFKDGFKNIIEKKRKDFVSRDLLENADHFIDDCKEDGRYNHRLCKIITSEAFNDLTSHKNKFPKYFSRFKLSLELDKKNKIKYNGKKDINEILNILMRKYALDGLTEQEMLIIGVEEYIS